MCIAGGPITSPNLVRLIGEIAPSKNWGKIVQLLIIQRRILRFFPKCVMCMRYVSLEAATLTKFTSDQIQDGGRPPSFQSVNRYNSVTDCQISLKLGKTTQLSREVRFLARNTSENI